VTDCFRAAHDAGAQFDARVPAHSSQAALPPLELPNDWQPTVIKINASSAAFLRVCADLREECNLALANSGVAVLGLGMCSEVRHASWCNTAAALV
jgi:hypothetical protein